MNIWLILALRKTMMSQKVKFVWNIPNTLSLYRIVAFPFILVLLALQDEKLFTLFICINLITDILDGLIARTFNMVTEIGARLDSIADFGTYIAVFGGLFVFRYEVLQPYLVSFFIFLGMFAGSYVVSLFKFKRLMSFHLYSWKICGYIQGIWFFTIFVFGFWAPYYYFMVITGTLAFAEHIAIQLLLKEPKSNLKGLYWILKNKN